MNTNKQFPFMNRDEYIRNANERIIDGYYKGNEENINTPESYTYGVLIVFSTSIYVVQQYILQGTYCYQRISVDRGSSWRNWTRIDNFGYNTLEELAAALKPLLGL